MSGPNLCRLHGKISGNRVEITFIAFLHLEVGSQNLNITRPCIYRISISNRCLDSTALSYLKKVSEKCYARLRRIENQPHTDIFYYILHQACLPFLYYRLQVMLMCSEEHYPYLACLS